MLTPIPACVASTTFVGGHFQMYALDGNAGVEWRLLSANNRELGRGASGYSVMEDCVAAIRDMIIRLDELTGQARPRPGSGWHWVLLAGTEPVVIGGRGYDRPIRARDAVRRFREHARTARIAETVALNGARRWSRAAVGNPIRTGIEDVRPIRDRDPA